MQRVKVKGYELTILALHFNFLKISQYQASQNFICVYNIGLHFDFCSLTFDL